MIFRSAHSSLIGSRKKNEDYYLIDEKLGLFAVADGVGGGLHGDVASKMVIEILHRSRLSGIALRKCFYLAQEELLRFSRNTFGDALMGTTLTAIEFSNIGVQLSHVGDSRCYHLSGNIIRQLSEDHETFEESMQNTVLSDYVGLPDDLVPLRVQTESFSFSGTQKFLLCTDGLHRQLSDREIIVEIGRSDSDPSSIVKRLGLKATQKEESDNVTLVCVEVIF